MRAHLALLSETNAPAMGQRSCWEASQPPDYLLLTRSSPAAQASSPMTLASPIKRPPKDRRFRHSGVRRPLPRLKEIQSRDGAVLRARLACRRATATHHGRWWAPVTSATRRCNSYAWYPPIGGRNRTRIRRSRWVPGRAGMRKKRSSPPGSRMVKTDDNLTV
jgi:hypothetical protein